MRYGSGLYGSGVYGSDSSDDGWLTPVTDRVAADCVYGNPKGCYDFRVANRIESNTQYIGELLLAICHTSYNNVYVTDWTRNSGYLLTDFNRLKKLIVSFRQSGIVRESTPEISLDVAPLSYTEINAMEQILLDVKTALPGLPYMYRTLGTFTSSNNYVLQVIRRR